MFIASLFVIIGVVFLLRNLGVISGDVWGVIWPIALVAFGLYLFLKHYYWKMFWDRVWRKLE
jgi:hypothetical protein